MDPVERQMQFVYTLRSRGVTNAEVLKAMEATAARAVPRRHLPGPLPRGYPAADLLRPDDQPADGGRADDPGAGGHAALQGARDRHRLGLSGGDPREARAAGLYRRAAPAPGAAGAGAASRPRPAQCHGGARRRLAGIAGTGALRPDHRDGGGRGRAGHPDRTASRERRSWCCRSGRAIRCRR